MSKRLVKVAKELNKATRTLVDLLREEGFEIENKPTSKVSDQMYEFLKTHFETTALETTDSSEYKEMALWKPIAINEQWLKADTSILDDISSSWFIKRDQLSENSFEYYEFLEQLKREHAIETGIIERLYDLDKGITETFIKEGFTKSQLSHNDTDIDKDLLINYLHDHFEAVDLVFDVVNDNRNLTLSFIKELHQLVTKNQDTTDAIDQFGNKTKVALIKGQFKKTPNNPSRPDGIIVLYCPPEHVDSEMENLISIYEDLLNNKVHPLIIATWFHHAFTTIHPFQDGNGRIARLLASLIFIKFDYFPITVLREEAKIDYISALEEADRNEPQSLIDYFGKIQKRNIQRALNIKDVSSTNLSEVEDIFANKVDNWKKAELQTKQLLLKSSRNEIFDYCSEVLNNLLDGLKDKVNGSVFLDIKSCSFEREEYQHFFYKQIISYAKKHNYFFNRSMPKAWLTFKIELSPTRKYQLGISIHHYGYDENTIAIGSFLEYKESETDEDGTILPLDIPPHVISISQHKSPNKRNIKSYLENALTLTLAQISSEI